MNECIILLHGLARTKGSMKPIAKYLNREGYEIININYDSRRNKIDDLAEQVFTEFKDQILNFEKVHFVTHSLGGIITRTILKKHSIENLGRVVMLGPPNQGSEIVDKLGGLFIFKLLNGPAGLELGTSEISQPNILGEVNFDLGVIAGNQSFNPFLSWIFDKTNDGKVSVDSTKIKGMADHIITKTSHTFMMQNRDILKQITHFIINGSFI